MANVDIKNAAPQVIDQGTQDLSPETVPVSTLEIPQHFPKFYIFAEKGELGPRILDLSQETLTGVYGDATIDPNSKYYTHQTPFLELCTKNGNNCVVHRLTADDAKDAANVGIYLDVLPTQVPLYEKHPNGQVKLDTGGLPITQKDGQGNDITVAGYKVAWVVDHTSADLGEFEPGMLTIRPGIQVDGATQSQQYPIREIIAASAGEAGNKLAVRMYAALQTDNYPFPTSFLSDAKVYPYYFQLVKLIDSATGKTEPVVNGFGSQFSRFSTKSDAQDPTTGLAIGFEEVVSEQYIESSTMAGSGLGQVISYDSNIEELLAMFYDAEVDTVDPARDSAINSAETNLHALNMVSFTSSNGSPYNAIKLVDVAGSVRLTRNTNLFLQGGDDGTISEALLDTLVQQDMLKYNDATSDYNDIVAHPESIIYDSGFAMDTKKALAKFISRRKDTFVVPATYAHNNSAYLLADQYSAGVALKSVYELYPESDTFGTSVMRAVIMTGSGKMIAGKYKKRVPLTYELLNMASKYMGAKNGAWKNGFAFDKAPRNVLSLLKDIDVTWVPSQTRQAMWSVGLNFALNFKIKQQFFPALQTVYDNDTSVLNSFFCAVAISYLNKVGHAAWRQYTGAVSLTAAQLEEAVNGFVADAVKDKFDGMFIIIPDCKVTEFDATRGYSFTLTTKIGAEVSRTVMTNSVQAYRRADLAGT